MRYWVVKGRPSRNDLHSMLVPGRTEHWVTRKPPRDWAAGDGVFFWKGAPSLQLVGLGQIETVRAKDARGNARFKLRYLTAPFEVTLTLAQLRRDPVLRDASFLKAGAAGTLFPLTPRHSRRLLKIVRRDNRSVRDFEWGAKPSAPSDERMRAISIRQPWVELILRGIKTIEVRSTRTHVRGRVYIYSSRGDAHVAHQERVWREHGIATKELPHGKIVGSVEIVGCRPLQTSDSLSAGFTLERGTKEFGWLLAQPERAARQRRPINHPQPVFFFPF